MRVLHRKLARDLVGSAATLLTVVATIAIGAGSFVGLGAAQRTLVASQDTYYRQYRFADFWVDVKKAPLSELPRIEALPGVADLQARVIFEVILDLPGETRPIGGRLISTPPRGFQNTLNGICLIRGSGFSDDRDEEVILSEAFAKAHGLQIGDRLSLILNRKKQSFIIVGTAISPEYVYMVRGPGDIIPDAEHFGTLYVKESYAREVLDFKDAFNQLTGRMVPDAHDDVDTLLNRIDQILAPYGVLELTPRWRQASNHFLTNEIGGLGITAAIMPTIFLGVAALVLNILMIRLAQRQRTIIGTLKALGYSDREVMTHYLGFSVVVGLLGGLAGIAIGVGLHHMLIKIYREFFQFPSFLMQFHPDLVLIALAISTACAMLGAIHGVRQVLKLPPAEAMRQRPPEKGGAIILERVRWFWRSLGFRTHMALRSLFRNRVRTATTIIAACVAVAIIFQAIVLYDSFFQLVDYTFEKTAHSDVDLGLREEVSPSGLYEARELPGIEYAEPTFGLICDLRHGRNSRRITITGLADPHRLTTPLLENGDQLEIPESGLVLSQKAAELLSARAGDRLDLTPTRGRRETRSVYVHSIAQTFVGMDCYASIEYLSRLIDESYAINGIQLTINPQQKDALYRQIKDIPNMQGLNVREESKYNIEQTLIKTSVISIGLMILFASIIGFGSTLNNALIEMGDRVREISTFRVLGYHPVQVAGILFRQSMATFIVGLLFAFPVGYALVWAIASAYDSELYRVPIFVRLPMILLTIGISLAFVLIAQWAVYRQVKKLDWLEGIKVKE